MIRIGGFSSPVSIFIGVLYFGSYAFSQGTWTSGAPIPTPLYGPNTGVINGQLYVAGGCCVTFSYPYTRFNTLQVYDPSTNTWTSKSPMPLAVAFGATEVINGKLYVAGGAADALNGNNVTELQIYDPSIDTWTTGASLPQANNGMNAGVINGKLYVASGNTPSNVCCVNTVVVYDPVADSWSSLSPTPNPRELAGTAVINGILYVVGGYTSAAVPVSTVDSYNPSTDSWTTLAPMPTPRYGLAAGVINAAGGTDNINTLATFESYDPVANTWTTQPSMLAATAGPAAGVINNTFYVATGTTISNQPVSAVQAFTVQTPVDMMQNLISVINGMGLDHGTSQSLIAKLNAAVADFNGGKTASACSDLGAQINEAQAQSGKHLTVAQANTIISAATQIRTELGC